MWVVWLVQELSSNICQMACQKVRGRNFLLTISTRKQLPFWGMVKWNFLFFLDICFISDENTFSYAFSNNHSVCCGSLSFLGGEEILKSKQTHPQATLLSLTGVCSWRILTLLLKALCRRRHEPSFSSRSATQAWATKIQIVYVNYTYVTICNIIFLWCVIVSMCLD